MVTKVLNRSDNVKLDQERKISDTIFNTLDYGTANSIENDIEYRRPSVKTWMYTNIENRQIWTTDSFVPMQVPINKDIPVKLREFNKCVIVIKTLDFKFRNKGDYSFVIKHLFSDTTDHGDVKQKVLDQLLAFKEGDVSYGVQERIRLTYIIYEDDLKDNKVVNVDSMLFSMDKPITREEVGSDLNRSKIFTANETIEFNFTSYSGKSLTINVFGNEIVLKNDSDAEEIDTELMSEDSLVVNKHKEGKCEQLGMYKRNVLAEQGYLVNSVDEKTEEFQEEAKAQRKELINSLNEKFDNNMVMEKFIYEHNVSLHKLLSYVVREEAALLALEKEEISTAKEFIKLLGSFK